MDPIERLNSLSEEVIQTFHSDFVFLIDAERSNIFLQETGHMIKLSKS